MFVAYGTSVEDLPKMDKSALVLIKTLGSNLFQPLGCLELKVNLFNRELCFSLEIRQTSLRG